MGTASVGPFALSATATDNNSILVRPALKWLRQHHLRWTHCCATPRPRFTKLQTMAIVKCCGYGYFVPSIHCSSGR
jgi:hypothetical protein